MSNATTNLGSLVRIRTGKLDANANDPDGAFPFFTCAKEPLRISSHSYDCECVLVAGHGDLNVKYYNGKFDAYQRTYIIESVSSEVLDVRYLYHFMDTYLEKLRHMSIGGVIKYIKIGNLTDAELPLPSLPEQRRIAAILDQAEALRAKRREALARLDSLTQSIFEEMFGDIQNIYANWPTKRLGEILDFLTSGSRGWAQYYSESGALFLRIQNVCRDELNLKDVAFVKTPETAEARRTKVLEGDVLLSITADLGRTAVVPQGLGKAHINQHLSIIRTKAVSPRFLSAFLCSPAGQREVMGRNKQAVKAGLNFDDIRSFKIPLPPESNQMEFVMRADLVSKQIKLQLKSLETLDTLFSSLQHRAFAGEL